MEQFARWAMSAGGGKRRKHHGGGNDRGQHGQAAGRGTGSIGNAGDRGASRCLNPSGVSGQRHSEGMGRRWCPRCVRRISCAAVQRNRWNCITIGCARGIAARLKPGAVQAIHSNLAESLVATGFDDPEVLFEHHHEAGQFEPAARYALLSAEKASAALAFDRAATFYGGRWNWWPHTTAERILV